MLLQLASRLDVSSRVKFAGHAASPEAVGAYLDSADLFVLPSRVEGLPRALIEAMARGLPCIGSRVGGVPELLPDEDLVDPGSVGQLVAKIIEMTSSPERLREAAIRNYEAAKEYREDVLASKRREFYFRVRQLTDCAVRTRGSERRFG
jgi:glycosyltransferase involved in cell wall biosynthesis